MVRPTPRSTRTDTLFPDTPRVRSDKPFLARWSQRKRQAVEEDAAAAAQADAETAAEPTVAPEAVDPATLPDIDALDVGADFTVFMREGVPNALKQRALRRLWQVDQIGRAHV